MTLSACDTGSGEARAGEGVMGLRRGFVEAGAQNLLMTLWPISDEFTIQIMSDFYEAALIRKSVGTPQFGAGRSGNGAESTLGALRSNDAGICRKSTGVREFRNPV